ncbi:hypothetical protein [Thalassospira sp. ER-Se-21-Dark]|uniref:hypothetical protein n=1 Tax=Thalassospira sp. ER-Se-21-Dark TaxID=2585190 RepID=UPI001B3086AB|nr:hypothetical protein [Thalassospira sp. ER-Se-21-Dark]
MTINQLTADEVLAYCRASLGLRDERDELDDILLAGLLRRAAGIFCPCSKTALKHALTDSLASLHTADPSTLADRLENLIETMLIAGDLLELSEVATEDPEIKGTWVFAAPPSFAIRHNGTAYLIGIAPDQYNLLPEHLDQRVTYSGTSRYILPKSGEDLAKQLTALGLNPLPETVWLKSPTPQNPEKLVDWFKKQLEAQSACGPISGLEILDHSREVTYYRGRWCTPHDHTGTYIARRPQEFGAPLWSFVELSNGNLQRIIDLPPKHYRWRGCDAAWYLQMAIDYTKGQPQKYKRSIANGTVRFDFFSPLPLWVHRRLIMFGQERPGKNSLFAYEMLPGEVEDEEKNLVENLWLARI